ncbi:MAG: hypothetical protein C0599_01880 [Salinivirgaceae bacterium]|nr:MAG: hypothetical protein C0599_01880 [Salinivirgaceae bacterium]
MINYTFDDSGIFHVSMSDRITLKDVKEYLIEFQNIENLPKELLLLYDLQKAVLDFEIDEIVYLTELADKVTTKYSSIKTAFLVEGPKVTAYSFMFSNEKKIKSKERKVFSTKAAAVSWLKKNPNQ